MKLAGGSHLAEMNPVAFLEQAREHEGGGGLRESLLKLISLKERTHPYTSIRALELTRWVEAGDYQRIMAGDYPAPLRRRAGQLPRGGEGRRVAVQGELRQDDGPADLEGPGLRRRGWPASAAGSASRCTGSGARAGTATARTTARAAAARRTESPPASPAVH